MNTKTTTDCTKCITSIQLTLAGQGLDPATLGDFIKDSLDISKQHFQLIESTLTYPQQINYKIRHYQAELLLSLLNRAKA